MPYWLIKYGLPALSIAFLIWGAYAWRQNDIRHWKDAGRSELAEEVRIAKEIADEETRKKQAVIRQQNQRIENEILSDKSGDRPISPVIARQLTRMRSND